MIARYRPLIVMAAVLIVGSAVITALGGGTRTRTATPAAVPAATSAPAVQFQLDRCTDTTAEGTIRNQSGVTVDVEIDAYFLDSNGTQVGDGLDFVRGLEPNGTASWTAYYTGTGSVAKCRAELGHVYRH